MSIFSEITLVLFAMFCVRSWRSQGLLLYTRFFNNAPRKKNLTLISQEQSGRSMTLARETKLPGNCICHPSEISNYHKVFYTLDKRSIDHVTISFWFYCFLKRSKKFLWLWSYTKPLLLPHEVIDGEVGVPFMLPIINNCLY